jgi:predicted DNA-binding transcriptional regulator AlpA
MTPTTPTDRAQARSRLMSRGSKTHLRLLDILDDLGVSRSTFHDWRAKGRAPRCLKLPNGELRIRRTDYEAWLRTLETGDL